MISRFFYLFVVAWCLTVPLYVAAQEGSAPGDRAVDIGQIRRLAAPDGGDSLAPQTTSPTRAAHKRESLGAVVFRIGGYLLVIVLLIFGVSWSVKKLGMGGSSRGSGGAMDIVEVLPLGQNKSLMLVRVSQKVHVIASAPQSLTCIDTIEGDTALEIISSSKDGTSMVQFKELFAHFVGKGKKSS